MAARTLFTVLALLATSAPPALAAPATVEQFSPQGEAKPIRQVVARFTQPMVPLGDPRGGILRPFEIDCAPAGTSRWVDSRNWVHEFDQDLPAGVRCTFAILPNLVTLAGNPVAPASFSFTTGGPAVSHVRPWPENEIDEDQAFILFLDGEVSLASVIAHTWFTADGIAEKVGVNIVEGAEREKILDTLYEDPGATPVVVVQARQRFPNGAKVSLSWGAGIESKSGIPTSTEQTFAYETRKPFTAELSCRRENAKADCMPLSRLQLSFSAPVPARFVGAIGLRGADGREWKAKADEHGESTSSVEFAPPFPERGTFELRVPAELRDDAGRSLANADRFPLTVKTGAFPPLAKFSSRFGIIEAEAEPVLPVTVRSVEPEIQTEIGRVTAERDAGLRARLRDLWDGVVGNVVRLDSAEPDALLPWLRRIAWARRSESVFQTNLQPAIAPKSFRLPKPNGADELEVVGVPLGSPGLYIVELESPRLGEALLGKQAPMYVATAALVTNLAVHFKWGEANSLVWVTTLDAAQPVAEAEVIIQNCSGDTVWTGTTDADGIARIDRLPGRDDGLPNCSGLWSPDYREGEDFWLEYDYDQTSDLRSMALGYLVIARTRRDISFVHSSWQRGIESWRFAVPAGSAPSPLTVHTIFDRTLFRAGESVHMKHLARLRSLSGFALPADEQMPASLMIQHEGSNDKYELPVSWDAARVAENVWKIPPAAKLGTYSVTLKRGNDWRWTRTSGNFRVEEFRVPLMRAKIGLPAQPQVGVTSLPVDLEASYLAGGAASGLPVVVRSQIRAHHFQPPIELERFAFANGTVEPGITRTREYDDGSEPQPAIHQRQEIQLDESATRRTTVTDLPVVTEPRDLLVEMEFRDPNGERQTVASSVPLWPAAALAGIHAPEWVSSKDKVTARIAVVDVRGKVVAGAKVAVEAFKRTTYSHRERLAGGFYAYEHVTEISPSLGVLCEGATEPNGLFFCDAPSPAEGALILVASTTDSAGNRSSAQADVWVAGDSSWWFDVSHSDRIDVLPEKPEYEPGETARFQVRLPFAEATALVSVEREGIAHASVVHLSGTNPVVEVPMVGSYAPNVFVSVLVVRGRIGGVQPTAMVDLGRPAYKLGIAEVRVGWRAHQLDVKVEPEAPTYRVREKARVRIHVRTANGEPPPAGSEVAFAAVDEGLLELRGNESWELLRAMMGRRSYSIDTSTAQMQVVGKRHYGLKALPQGGGGGQQPTRELFDTLLLWKPRVALDAGGDAIVELPLNDSLTSFRLVAVATAAAELFGTGSATIRSTQDLMILPALVPVAREGDRLRTEVTIRNTTNRAFDVRVTGNATGIGVLLPQSVAVAAGAAAPVGWDMTVPAGVEEIVYEIEASEAGGASDQVRRLQKVLPAVPVRTFEATLVQVSAPIRQPVRQPLDALPERGGIHVDVAPSLVAGLGGVRQWIDDYPYTCFEQKLAKAVIRRDEPQHWRELSSILPSYLDGVGLLKFFPTQQDGSEVLTAHTLALTNAAGLSIPEESLNRMLDGLRRFVDGEIQRQPWARLALADLALRKLAAVEALARFDKAQASMLDSVTIQPNLWPTSAVITWWNILRRMPALPGRDAKLAATEQVLRSRLDLAGTSIRFSSAVIDNFWWLISPPDTNPLRLILAALDAGVWDEELPRLIRGAFHRQQRGAWDSTVSNAWGSVAVEKFAQRFEATAVSGVTTAALAPVESRVDWGVTSAGAALDLSWPTGEGAATLSIDHRGGGAPWVVMQARAAIPLREPLSAGYSIKKTVVPVEVKTAGKISAGDIVRIRLDVEAQRDMTWVVFDDPIPAGASHLGTGLGRDSSLATATEGGAWGCSPVFVERSFAAIRAYYECLPKGATTLEYVVRFNQPGTFQMPTTRVEALYTPEMFGELPNEPVVVLP